MKYKLNTSLFASLAGIAALTFSSLASANLVTNGSFETIGTDAVNQEYGSLTTWQVYDSIVGWEASRNMEIWTEDFIVPAHDGNNILELNGHPASGDNAFSIGQSFATVVGQQYELSFAGRKRDSSGEAFSVSVGDIDYNITSHSLGDWTEFSYIFTAIGAQSTLLFSSLDDTRDTTGNLLDSVSVVSVPEPSIIALFGLGLVGLGFARRRKS